MLFEAALEMYERLLPSINNVFGGFVLCICDKREGHVECNAQICLVILNEWKTASNF